MDRRRASEEDSTTGEVVSWKTEEDMETVVVITSEVDGTVTAVEASTIVEIEEDGIEIEITEIITEVMEIVVDTIGTIVVVTGRFREVIIRIAVVVQAAITMTGTEIRVMKIKQVLVLLLTHGKTTRECRVTRDTAATTTTATRVGAVANRPEATILAATIKVMVATGISSTTSSNTGDRITVDMEVSKDMEPVSSLMAIHLEQAVPQVEAGASRAVEVGVEPVLEVRAGGVMAPVTKVVRGGKWLRLLAIIVNRATIMLGDYCAYTYKVIYSM